MEYTKIFEERRHDNQLDQKQPVATWVEVAVYAPQTEFWGLPILIRQEWGNVMFDYSQGGWVLSDWARESEAIREAIKWIDAFELGFELSGGKDGIY